MSVRMMGPLVVTLGLLAGCDNMKSSVEAQPKAADPPPPATGAATATAVVVGAGGTVAATGAAHPGAPATPGATATTTAVVGNPAADKKVTATNGPGGANVNLQNQGKQGNIATTPGNVQIQGAAGTINIPSGGGLPSTK